MAFTLRQLQFFIAAAEAGSVSGAARALSISQSSVTEAIRALEDDLGITLFDRLPRGLEITHKGSAFLRHARQILADVATARAAFHEETQPLPGKLSLGVTSLVAGYVLSDILQRYRRAFPQIELNVIEDNGDYLQHLLIGGELDVAVLLTSSVKDRMALNVETLLVSLADAARIAAGGQTATPTTAQQGGQTTAPAAGPRVALTLEDAVKLLSACPNIQLLLNAVHFSPSGRRFGSYYGYRG